MFWNDLSFGVSFEKKLMDYLSEDGDKTHHNVGVCDSSYDFSINETKYEVKACRVGHRTRNLAIEVMSNGKRSGINVSEADRWLYYIVATGMLINIPTRKLRKLTKQDNVKTIRACENGKNIIKLVSLDSIPKRYISYPKYDDSENQ